MFKLIWFGYFNSLY